MRGRAFVSMAFALMLGVAATAAQERIETRGAWRLVADGEDFALRTQAVDAPESTLSLFCRKGPRSYSYEIKSPALASRPSGEEIRVGFKIDDDDRVWFTLVTGPDGTVPIAHETAFWIIHAALTRDSAKRVAFTAGDQIWQFTLDGLRDSGESLTSRCGFAPERPLPRRRR